MRVGTRGQSQLVGTVLLVAVMVISVTVVGTFILDSQAEQIRTTKPSVDFTSALNASNVKIIHAGGSAISLADLDLILRNGDERRYDLDDPDDRNSTGMDGDTDFESGEWVLVDHAFEGEVRIQLVETASGGHVLYDETKTVPKAAANDDPTIEQFDVTDTSSGGDASFDVTWNASDDQGDITEVTVELINDGTVEDSATTTFSEVETTGVNTDTLTNASGGDEVYKIKITVTDAEGNTETDSKSDTADSNIGLRSPTIEKFDVSDTSSGQDASYDITYNASDPDDDIIEVRLKLIKEATSTVVDNTTDSYSQVGTTGMETDSLNDTSGKNKNDEYRINITVKDAEGNEVSDTTTDTADGSGGGGGGGSDPTIDTFDVSDTSTCSGGPNKAASYEISWSVSDADGNLNSVTLEMIRTQNSNVDDSVSYTTADPELSGSSGSNTDTLSENGGCSKEYKLKITVDDTSGNTVTDSWTDTADGSGSN